MTLPLTMGADGDGCGPTSDSPDVGSGTDGTLDDTDDEPVFFTDSYKRDAGGTCASEADSPIIGYAPAGAGPHPLFIYTVGTFDRFDNPIVHEILQAATDYGFVAVSVSYDNNLVFSCGDVDRRARCVYDPDDAQSLANKMCLRDDVDCDLGIVTAGHSQGAGMAIVSGNYNAQIRAAWGLGVTCDYVFSFGEGDTPGLCSPDDPAAACYLSDNTALDGDHIRAVSGENDQFAHPNEWSRVTGVTCQPGSTTCLTQTGGGWLMVTNDEVEDGSADHGFFVDGLTNEMDPGFALPAENSWSLGTNLEWLASHVTP